MRMDNGFLPSIGSVSNKSITRILILGIRLIALNGRNTLIVRIAVKFKFSTCKQYSKAPDMTMKKSKRFHESAKYVPLPHPPCVFE